MLAPPLQPPDDWEWCRAFIDHHCIFRSPPGELVITSADHATNAWQFYLPIAVLDQEFAERIGRLFWDRYEGAYIDHPFQLCGCESGGSLLLSVLQTCPTGPRKQPVPAFMIKKAAKSYGLENWIEGVADPQIPVLLVDDVAGSGKTITTQAERLKDFGFTVTGAWAIASVQKEPPLHFGGRLEFSSLFSPRDFSRLHGEYTRKYGSEPQFMGTVT